MASLDAGCHDNHVACRFRLLNAVVIAYFNRVFLLSAFNLSNIHFVCFEILCEY